MARKKIYDSKHQQMTISNWIYRGLTLREGETYKDIYSFVMNTDFCNLCKCNFTKKNWRCMDHDHATGFFRQILCNNCNSHFDKKSLEVQKNNKLGHLWIAPKIDKKKNGKVYVAFGYKRTGFKGKSSTSLTKLIALSFINILKVPI